jgi:hypothetical protein
MTAMMNDGHRVMIADAGQKVSEAMLRAEVCRGCGTARPPQQHSVIEGIRGPMSVPRNATSRRLVPALSLRGASVRSSHLSGLRHAQLWYSS